MAKKKELKFDSREIQVRYGSLKSRSLTGYILGGVFITLTCAFVGVAVHVLRRFGVDASSVGKSLALFAGSGATAAFASEELTAASQANDEANELAKKHGKQVEEEQLV